MQTALLIGFKNTNSNFSKVALEGEKDIETFDEIKVFSNMINPEQATVEPVSLGLLPNNSEILTFADEEGLFKQGYKNILIVRIDGQYPEAIQLKANALVICKRQGENLVGLTEEDIAYIKQLYYFKDSDALLNTRENETFILYNENFDKDKKGESIMFLSDDISTIDDLALEYFGDSALISIYRPEHLKFSFVFDSISSYNDKKYSFKFSSEGFEINNYTFHGNVLIIKDFNEDDREIEPFSESEAQFIFNNLTVEQQEESDEDSIAEMQNLQKQNNPLVGRLKNMGDITQSISVEQRTINFYPKKDQLIQVFLKIILNKISDDDYSKIKKQFIDLFNRYAQKEKKKELVLEVNVETKDIIDYLKERNRDKQTPPLFRITNANGEIEFKDNSSKISEDILNY